MSDSSIDRLLQAAMKTPGVETLAIRALRRAVHLLGLAIGSRIAELRESDDKFLAACGRIEEHALLYRLHEKLRDIVASRWDKLPSRQRPFYTPEQRYRILRVKQMLALSRSQIANLVRVDKNTIARWETEVTRSPAPERTTIGALVKPQPPVRRYADVVRGVVQAMALAGFGGHQMIASTLARAGWRLSKRTVARIRKERYVRPTSPPPTPEAAKRHRVSARYPNHLFMLDITEIPSLFRILLFRLAVVFDAFSRMPLAASISAHEPTGDETAQLLRTAIHNHSAPRHLVTDHGSQFTSDDFKQPVNQAAIRHRFGAVHRTGSIALIERIWRTIKNLAGLRRRPPLTLDDCRRRVDLALLHYAYCRPHRALGGATPAEVHFGITPAHRSAIHGPTGRPGKLTVEQPFEILYLDDEQHLPFLFNNAA